MWLWMVEFLMSHFEAAPDHSAAAAAAAALGLSAKTVSMATDGQKIGGGAKEEMENGGKTKENIFARRNTYMSWAKERKRRPLFILSFSSTPFFETLRPCRWTDSQSQAHNFENVGGWGSGRIVYLWVHFQG